MTKYLNKDITKENTRKVHETKNKMPSFTQEWKRNVIKGMHYVLTGEAHVKTLI